MLFAGLLLRDGNSQIAFTKLLDFSPPLEQRKIVNTVLKLLSDKYLNLKTQDDSSATSDDPVIWAASGALRIVVGNDETRKSSLVSWLTSGSGAGIGESCSIRRAAVAVFADDKEAMAVILEKSLSQFGDQLYMKHSPLLQQDGNALQLPLSNYQS